MLSGVNCTVCYYMKGVHFTWLATDIDECTANTDGCGQICVNYAGGYNCSCIAGYALGQDLKTCLGN